MPVIFVPALPPFAAPWPSCCWQGTRPAACACASCARVGFASCRDFCSSSIFLPFFCADRLSSLPSIPARICGRMDTSGICMAPRLFFCKPTVSRNPIPHPSASCAELFSSMLHDRRLFSCEALSPVVPGGNKIVVLGDFRFGRAADDPYFQVPDPELLLLALLVHEYIKSVA